MGRLAQNRLLILNAFLNGLFGLRALPVQTRSEFVFEMYCYLLKTLELMDRGKRPQLHNIVNNNFIAHRRPGHPYTASFITFHENRSSTVELFLNASFEGRSGAFHSPDIVLRNEDERYATSIYECKDHSGWLALGICREFMGYIEEMGILRRGQNKLRNMYPEIRPSIYTTGRISGNVTLMQEKYNFEIHQNP